MGVVDKLIAEGSKVGCTNSAMDTNGTHAQVHA